MKTILHSLKLTAAVILAAAAFTSLAPTMGAADAGTAKGGAALLLPGKTADNAVTVKPGDPAASLCPKCKNVTVKQATMEKGHIEHVSTVVQHECPGCSSKLAYIGHGKMKQAEWTHACSVCGTKLASCCAAKAGTAPAHAMEK